LNLEHLPDHHKDPFDRMLISQALSVKMPLISHDPIIRKYPLEVLW
jgi:PIN domain nuclease of toxin-antitoxin system